ncbi:hypothetical protein SEA_YECEY3_63 [Mycobacterium phage Yecey3]|uniref:Uncharacterized protein n=1 Tax=Mycobacterium phage Yecey3 TaxID=2656617 RepID=A0A649V9D1_9CAUD|nr:hypothetical protein KIV58_gp046 [Mycobacterium phage Yecey3]QGJ88814.1 hypothetical protein SEA_YECEY3_63 [Mycobacterium phage Yecey3]
MTLRRKKFYRIDVVVGLTPDGPEEEWLDDFADAVNAALVKLGLEVTDEVCPYEVTHFE